VTEADFAAALDRWGGDLARWPAATAAEARALIAISPRAAAALTAARRLDDHLAALEPHRAPAELAARIRAQVSREPAAGRSPAAVLDRLLGWLGASGWRPAALGLLLLAAGYLAGLAAGETLDPELADDVVALAFTDIYAEIDDAR